jgi:Outer membrane protein beta-barrel domain
MKFKIYLSIVLLGLSLNSDAQRVVWSRFKFGIQASPTFSWLATDVQKIRGNGFNTGLKLGATADYYFLENYALSTGIGFGFNHGGQLLHETGGNFLANSTLSDPLYNTRELPDLVKIRYHIQYVEIPFALKMRTQQFGYIRIFAQAPVITLGWRTQARGDISAEKIDLKKENIKPDVNPLLITWGVGGGVEYDISPSTSLVGGLYFNRNMIDVTRNKGNYSLVNGTKVDEDSKAVLNAITLRLGIIF